MKKIIVFDVDGVILKKGRLLDETYKYIKENFEVYDFFTNATFSKTNLREIFERFNIRQYFLELLAYEDGSKKENIEYIMQVYGAKKEDILFIDDNISHINAVKDTGVHTLLFEQDGVSLEEKINKKINT